MNQHGAEAALSLRGIDKAFYGAHANAAVDFDLAWGEVHALLGENGAGKSTLCSIASGLYRSDAGKIVLDGDEVRFRSPREALAAGVGMVYQHFKLVDNLTVAENIVLGHPGTGFHVSRRRARTLTAELADRYALPVDPRARIWQLSVGEQQRVEILKLLHRDARILILDEPTAVLTPQETKALFATIRVITGEGRAVVFVSHKLEEVMEISDRITVLRDGRNVGSLETGDADPATLARMMVGREFSFPERTAAAAPGDVVLAVAGLRVAGDRGLDSVAGVSLEVRSGEVVGLAGVSGNGQRELAEVIAGMRRAAAGSVAIGGVDVTAASPRRRIRAGLGFVPEDRLGMGLAPGLGIVENLALRAYRDPPMSRGPVLDLEQMRRKAFDLVEQFDVRGVRGKLPVGLLSGGNLQKAVLAREIDHDPRVLLAAAPTRGLDVGATTAVRSHLLGQRDSGTGVLLISEDLEELLALSDRILVIHRGRIVGEVPGESADAEEIGLMMAGAGR